MNDALALPLSLDPLMAEAKRRMRRRRVILLGTAAVAVAAGLLLTVQPWGGGGHALGVPASDTAIAQTPGMTRVTSSSVGRSACLSMKGATSTPYWCNRLKLRGGRGEGWILTTAYEEGSRFNVSAAFAKAHPGPVTVTDQWLRLASVQQATQLVHNPDFNLSYTGHPAPAINGGVARSIDSYFPGQRTPAGREIEFFWASGRNVFNVNVRGAGLTAGEAQQIALLARPR